MTKTQGLPFHNPQIQKAMLKFALLHIQPREEAEDAVQDCLIALLEASTKLESLADVRPYVFGVLRNKIADRLRNKYRHNALHLDMQADDFDELLFDLDDKWLPNVAPAKWSSPDAQFESEQFFQVVDFCVERLPKQIAQVFSMREFLDFDAPSICEVLNITKAAYWQCLSRARKQLQICLNNEWFNGEAL